MKSKLEVLRQMIKDSGACNMKNINCPVQNKKEYDDCPYYLYGQCSTRMIISMPIDRLQNDILKLCLGKINEN